MKLLDLMESFVALKMDTRTLMIDDDVNVVYDNIIALAPNYKIKRFNLIGDVLVCCVEVSE